MGPILAKPRCDRTFGLALLAASFSTLLISRTASAAPPTAITLDGSLGAPAGNITASSPHLFQIAPGMGKTVGPNLFQSFGTFNLGTGDTASFLANGGTQNIIARVTGGSTSSIDGTLQSPVNLFFLNPAGVMFGANAQVNVAGAFVVSTANMATLRDGATFYADANHPLADQGLSSAPVSAFGFLTPTPQPVSFIGSQIGSSSSTTLTGIHVIAGDITLDNAGFFTPGGVISLFSAANAGAVPFSLTPTGTQYQSATVTHFGAIKMTNGALAEINGNGGGAVVIRGGKITADSDSAITSFNSANVVGGDISVQADQLTLTGGSFIGTDTNGGAQGGSIAVAVAGELSVSGADPNNNESSEISANTETPGNGGNVSINAASVNVGSGGVISANVSTPGAFGHGGTVTVIANSMTMTGTSRVSAISDGEGDAGTVQLTLSGPLTMSDTAEVIADAFNSGHGGDVNINAGQIRMTGESTISANTVAGPADGGTVTVHAGSLSIEGDRPLLLAFNRFYVGFTGIFAESVGPGNAGSISVTAGQLSMNSGAVISTAGIITGNGGPIAITCTQGQLSNQSEISTAAATDAGSVQITAADSFTLSDNSSINTSAINNGGDITLRVGRLLYLSKSNIEAYAGLPSLNGQPAQGNGGNIDIDPEFVVLDHSLISANNLSGIGQNGDITNLATFFFTNDSLLHATGTIDTTPPDLDLAGSLILLPGNLIDAGTQLRERCERAVNHEFSTLVVVGRGGTESAPQELHPDFGIRLSLPESRGGDSTSR